MAILTFKIESILGGQSPLYHGSGEGQFLNSQAIDPEYRVSSSHIKPSGHIIPVGYETFSGDVPSGAPMWIVTNPHDQKIYVYGDDGEVYSYSDAASLGSETSITTSISGKGNGMAYYNDYLYIATPTQVYRYGKLSGTPSLSNALIASSELLEGWDAGSETTLTDTTYPQARSVSYPNHAMFPHSDGFLYICDYSTTKGGMLHRIGTDVSGSNSGSQYNVLDLPHSIKPFAGASYGTSIAVVGSSGESSNTRQHTSHLFLWDGIEDSFYKQIPIPCTRVTAIANVNGTLRIWGGNQDFGHQMLEYDGEDQIYQVWESMYGSPPFAGAVDVYGNHVAWGTYFTSNGIGQTNDAARIMTHAYQNRGLGTQAVHSVGVADTLSGSPVITSLKYTEQLDTQKYPIIGYRAESSTHGLAEEKSTATKDSSFQSQVFQIERSFKVREIRVPLTDAVDANVTITPKIVYDDGSTEKTLTTINNTNYPSERYIKYSQGEIEAASTAGYTGRNNFFLEFNFTGTSEIGVALPIEITVETLDD